MTRTLGASLVLIFWCDLSSWHRAPETSVLSWVIGVSFVPMRWLWVGSWMAPLFKGWAFQPYPRILLRRTRNGLNIWWCLHDESSLQSQTYGVQSFEIDECIHVPGRWYTPTSQGQKKLLHSASFQISPSVSLSLWLFICTLYHNKSVNCKCFPAFCELL